MFQNGKLKLRENCSDEMRFNQMRSIANEIIEMRKQGNKDES